MPTGHQKRRAAVPRVVQEDYAARKEPLAALILACLYMMALCTSHHARLGEIRAVVYRPIVNHCITKPFAPKFLAVTRGYHRALVLPFASVLLVQVQDKVEMILPEGALQVTSFEWRVIHGYNYKPRLVLASCKSRSQVSRKFAQ